MFHAPTFRAANLWLCPLMLSAQPSDSAVQDKLKSLNHTGAPTLSLRARAQFEVREFFSKSHVRSEANDRIQVSQTSTTFEAKRESSQVAMTWTRPILVNPGEEEPAEPATLEAWFQPHRLDGLLSPAQALLGLVEGAVLKEIKETVFEGELARHHTYQFKTRVPKKFEGYAIDREANLLLITSQEGLPLLAELTTGYRGRVGRRGDPFGRRTHVWWTFRLNSGALATRTYDIREEHRSAWTTTATLIGLKVESDIR